LFTSTDFAITRLQGVDSDIPCQIALDLMQIKGGSFFLT